MMNKTILYIMFICVFVSVSFATYSYTITAYQMLPDLSGNQSMLIEENGGGDYTALSENSFLNVESTSGLNRGHGGIWEINMSGSSYLEITGGEVHMIDMDDDSMAVLKGGLMEEIRIDQLFYLPDGEPHITLYYLDNLPTLNASNILTGLWGNGDSFGIQLVNDTGVECNLLDNFTFVLVPEPVTLALLAFGGLLIHRKQ